MLEKINAYIALPILPVLLILAGGYLTVKMGILRPKRLYIGIKSLFCTKCEGGVSPFAALSVALAGTLGVGNIVGVAVALSLGGAGAVFWMWICAFFSLGIKYTETVLAVKYRYKEGESCRGGPMYYIFHGMGNITLARIFCVLCIASSLASGCVIQSNSAAAAINETYGVPCWATGAVLCVLCGVIVIGGIKSISRFTSLAVPLMTAVFIALSLIAIFKNLQQIPDIFVRIVKEAFGVNQAASGAGGFFISQAVKHGAAKSALSNEAGAGTSPISHAGANTKSPVEQGFLGMFEVFADTIVMCTLTAFVILGACPNIAGSADYGGVGITNEAYGVYFGKSAHHIITVCIAFFAFATLICWSYYGVKCVEFLCKSTFACKTYLAVYCACILAGAVVTPEFMWTLTDLFTCAMIFLNVPAVLRLNSVAKRETEKYYSDKCSKDAAIRYSRLR